MAGDGFKIECIMVADGVEALGSLISFGKLFQEETDVASIFKIRKYLS